MSRVVSLVLLGASIVAMGVVMLLGTSAAVPYFGPTRPFLTLGGSPSPITVTVLTWFAAVAAGAGTLAGLHALRRGPFAAPRRLLLAGAVTACVFALLPPVASVDMLNYAIYGRIADLGRDPYVTTPLRLARTGDPVGALLPSGWQRVPTVYGPIATAVQWLAAHIGGNSMARILFLLKWANATAFIGTGLLLDRLARPDPARRVRACLLWTVNPIMLFWMVGSGHADALAVLFLVAAVYAARRSAFQVSRYRNFAVSSQLANASPAASITWISTFVLSFWTRKGSPTGRSCRVFGVGAACCRRVVACWKYFSASAFSGVIEPPMSCSVRASSVITASSRRLFPAPTLPTRAS